MCPAFRALAARGGALAGLPLALLVAACGGGGGSSFAARADAICIRESQAVKRLPAPHDFAEQQADYEKQVAIVREEIAALRRLDAPDELRLPLQGLIKAIKDELDAGEYLHLVGLFGDVESAEGADYRGREAARRAFVYALRLGLSACGRAPAVP